MTTNGTIAPPALPSGLPALLWLTRRELHRFVRQPSRIAAAVGTPLLVWVFFGSGFAGSFAPRSDNVSYTAYLIPGMAALAALFSSIFAAISLIEDRQSGFLQSVLVSPAPRWAVAGAKVLGSSAVAAGQAALLLVPALLMGVGSPAALVPAFGAILVIAVLISGIGLAAAWHIDSVPGFHGVMNLVLMPMWLLSGSVFPVSGAAGWLRVVMLANPLTWPTAAMRGALIPGAEGEIASPATVWLLTILIGLGGFALAWTTVGRRRA